MLNVVKSSSAGEKNTEIKETIEQKAEELEKKVISIPKKNLILIAVLGVLTIILVVFALFSGASKTTIVSKPVVDPNAYKQTLLSLTTPQVSSSSATIYESSVIISSNINTIRAIGLRLSYNPKDITITDIKFGDFLNKPTVLGKKINAVNGTISYDLVLYPDQTPSKGSGTVATISFKTVTKNVTTSINILPTTETIAKGYLQSALKTANGITFVTK
jgi:hypothetical protein